MFSNVCYSKIEVKGIYCTTHTNNIEQQYAHQISNELIKIK
jgi:hypothetical protein